MEMADKNKKVIEVFVPKDAQAASAIIQTYQPAPKKI